MKSKTGKRTRVRANSSAARSARRVRVASLLVTAAALLPSASAFAALGASASSIASDRQAIEASSVSTTVMPAFERHEMTMPSGTSVREFTSSAAGVFAVDFSGPTMPDLKTLLGTHYDDYLAAAQARHGINHHFMSFESHGLVVRIVKLPRGFEGRVHLPASTPSGVDVNSLR